jgi:predicted RNase H-like nuclease (RuvC/YqgF family)
MMASVATEVASKSVGSRIAATGFLQQQLEEESKKIQRWHVSTQMELDAKLAEIQDQTKTLEQQASELRDQHQRSTELQQKLEAKEQEVATARKTLDKQISVNTASESEVKVSRLHQHPS